MLKKGIMMLLLAGGLLACGNNQQETERPEPVIEEEIDLDPINTESDTISPADTLVVPRGTGENI